MSKSLLAMSRFQLHVYTQLLNTALFKPMLQSAVQQEKEKAKKKIKNENVTDHVSFFSGWFITSEALFVCYLSDVTVHETSIH